MKKVIAQIKYTYSEKISTLKVLERNDYNLLKTERICGISRPTLRRWKEQYGDQVFSGSSPVEETLKRLDIEMARNDVKILKKYYLIRSQLLDRIMELIPSETRLDPLVSTLKSINEEIINIDEMGKNVNNTPTNFIQILNEQLKFMDHEPTED